MSTDAMRATEHDAPTTELVAGAVGDRCPNCQTPLAPDQRYCVNCGERRGRPRFSYEQLTVQAPAAASESAPPRGHAPRLSSGTTLIAGIATLLIAIGVGVLIGHYSSGGSTRAATEVVNVRAPAGAAAPVSAPPTTTVVNPGPQSAKVHVTHVVVPAKAAKAANQAAAKVLGGGSGGGSNLSKNVNQTVGASCSGGAGCQGGHFTGNFFPGG